MNGPQVFGDTLVGYIGGAFHELPTADIARVGIKRSAKGVRIDVRYIVRVDFPLYTVDLHFYPGAGSR